MFIVYKLQFCLVPSRRPKASRMESTSEPLKIHISQTTRALLSPDYSVTDRGEIAVKGKGKYTLYTVYCTLYAVQHITCVPARLQFRVRISLNAIRSAYQLKL